MVAVPLDELRQDLGQATPRYVTDISSALALELALARLGEPGSDPELSSRGRGSEPERHPGRRALTARVRLAAGIPQAWTTGGIDRPRMRRFLERADALGFESAWVVEQVLGSAPEPRARGAPRMGRRGDRPDPPRDGRPADTAPEPGASGQEPRDRRSALGRPPRRRDRPWRQPEDLPRLRHQCGAPGGALQRGAPAHAGPLDRAARDLRRRVLAARERRARAEAAPAPPSAALGRRAPPRRVSPVRRLGGGLHGGRVGDDRDVRAGGRAAPRSSSREAGRDPASIDIGKRVYVAVDRDRDRAGRRLAEYFGGFYGRPQLAAEVSVWGSVDQCVAGPPRGHRRRRRLVMLNPVFDEVEQLEVLAAEVVPRL